MSEPIIVCADCRGRLAPDPAGLRCSACNAHWPLEDGFPKLFREREVRPLDRFMRLFYNGLPALHDPLTRHLLPWLSRDSSEAALRLAALSELKLDLLAQRAQQRPLHILEVGVGAGANLPFVQSLLPRELALVYWGLDLSRGMLTQCRKRLSETAFEVRLLLGDAHRLPFPDRVFDRVFHIGAMGSYGAPALALAEMGRVAKPNTPIVVVDEQLDVARHNTLRDRLAFRLLTFYDPNPHCPEELLPRAANSVRSTQITRFYYCLSFAMPEEPAPSLSTIAP